MGKFVDEVLPKFADAPDLPESNKGTVAWVIETYIKDMASPAINRPVGNGGEYCLRAIQRDPIGAMHAPTLTKTNVTDFGKRMRVKQGRNGKPICPATVGKYIGHLSAAIKHVAAVVDGCDDLTPATAVIKVAKLSLEKLGVIGKSAPRERRPTLEEIKKLLELAEKSKTRFGHKIDMVKLQRWQIAAGMRLGASCKVHWLHWNPEDQTMTIHGMKDPRTRNKIKVIALRHVAQEMLLEMAYAMNAAGPEAWGNTEPRIFPYDSKSASQAGIRLRRQAGIVGLRLHDLRRECASQLVEDEGFSAEEAIQHTGHETTQQFLRTYMRLNPAKMKHGPAAKREQRA